MRLVKGADQVFSGAKIHPGFAANGTIHLRQQRRGYLHKGDAAQRKKLFAAMKLDKKVSNGEVKFVLAEKIGKVVWGRKVSVPLIDEVLPV